MKKVKLAPSTASEVKVRSSTTREVSPTIVAAVLGAELVAEVPSGGSPLSRRAAGDHLRANAAAAPSDERIVLWAHCVSEHAVIMSPKTPLDDLRSYHDSEHRGPGTIRNHDPASRAYSLKKLGAVLSESDEDES